MSGTLEKIYLQGKDWFYGFLEKNLSSPFPLLPTVKGVSNLTCNRSDHHNEIKYVPRIIKVEFSETSNFDGCLGNEHCCEYIVENSQSCCNCLILFVVLKAQGKEVEKDDDHDSDLESRVICNMVAAALNVILFTIHSAQAIDNTRINTGAVQSAHIVDITLLHIQ